jgi:tRNA(Ile)-lysidine synthase
MSGRREREVEGEPSASGPVYAVRRAVELALTEGGLRPARGRILIALSGGPDSRVLLDALLSLAPRLALELEVCVVDHGLRHGSAREAQAAIELAEGLGLHAELERVFPEDKSARAARDARYAALTRLALARGLEAIALGHTATDQAETLLDHLLRGAGSRGLGAMAPKRAFGGPREDESALFLIRPMLEVPRAEVEAYLEAEGLSVVRDPTNEDLRYRRSRIRHRVLPLLREERPDLDRALTRLCERMRLDADYLEQAAAAARAELVSQQGSLDLERLSSLHPALAARVLRELCEAAGVAADRVPTSALLRLCRGRHGTSALDLPGGVVAERRYARLRIGAVRTDAPEAEPAEVLVTKGGTVELGPFALRLPQSLFKAGPLLLRRPRAGDRVRGKRLSDLLIDQKVPRPDRARLWALARPDKADGGTDENEGLTWVGLISAEAPGKISWEWPCKGTRPRIASKAGS